MGCEYLAFLLRFVERKLQTLKMIGNKSDRKVNSEKHSFINVESKCGDKAADKNCAMCNRIGQSICLVSVLRN